MFGTRAGIIEDITLAVSLLAPVVTYLSIRWVRLKQYDLHRKVQIALLVVGITAVVALETRIRLAGGSGSLLQASSPENRAFARAALGVHISGAVLTYVLWTYLAVASHKRFQSELPGPFSRRHKKLGKWVFAGLVFTALSAAVMYALAFVL